jgi:hypothetical protein
MGPNAAGANLPDNNPRKRFNYKPNASKGFEGSSRGTFPKSPPRRKNKLTDKSKFEAFSLNKKAELFLLSFFIITTFP